MSTLVQVSNVQWDFSDTPGKKPKLPTRFVVEIDDVQEGDGDEGIEDDVSEAISNMHGFCHTGFSYYIIKSIKVQAGD